MLKQPEKGRGPYALMAEMLNCELIADSLKTQTAMDQSTCAILKRAAQVLGPSANSHFLGNLLQSFGHREAGEVWEPVLALELPHAL